MSTIIGLVIFLIVVAAAIWSGRTPPTSGGIDNQTAIRRYRG